MPLYPPASSGSGAPTDAQYVTLATDATLTVERVLTGTTALTGPGIKLTDAGAGSTITLSIPNEQWGVCTGDITNATTTPADATGMKIAISASATEIWFFDVHLYANGPIAGDYKFNWTVPTSATMAWGTQSPVAGADYWGPPIVALTTAPNTLLDQTASVSLAASNSNYDGYLFRGFMFGGGTAGDIQLQFAQAAASGTSTLKKGSVVRAWKVIA